MLIQEFCAKIKSVGHDKESLLAALRKISQIEDLKCLTENAAGSQWVPWAAATELLEKPS